jgi:hypothetical protein
MADMIVRYDLEKMKEEVKADFSPEAGSHRLLQQADISKRFQRKNRPATPAPDPKP